MITIFIALAVGFAAGYFGTESWGPYWGLATGVAVALAVQLLIGLLIRKKINAVNNKIQNIMVEGQNKVNRMIQQFQRKSPGSLKVAQEMLEKEQAKTVEKALETTREMDKFAPWNLLLSRQIATMRMMLNYQIKNFSEADKAMRKAIFMDPRSVAMKMARMYKHDDPKLEKFYRRKSKRAKGENAALLHGLYAWICLKRGDEAKALEVMAKAKEKNEHEVIKSNYEKLANGKAKQFTMSGLGDVWYALYLEEPKVKQQRQNRMY